MFFFTWRKSFLSFAKLLVFSESSSFFFYHSYQTTCISSHFTLKVPRNACFYPNYCIDFSKPLTSHSEKSNSRQMLLSYTQIYNNNIILTYKIIMRTITTAFFVALVSTVFPQTNENRGISEDSLFKTVTLHEVKVSAPAKTKLKGNSMVTRVAGTAIATVGTAEDALACISGMMKIKGELQVIGKGAPTYYINGRKVHDPSELQNLSSHDIRNVEVITNPGAQYPAETNAVVRINTLKRCGEGFGITVDIHGDVAPSCGNGRTSSIANMNYRHNDTDFFGGFSFSSNHLKRYDTEASQTTFGERLESFSLSGTTHMSQRYNTLKMNIGMNTMLGEHHSMGFRIERTEKIKGVVDFSMEEDVLRNGSLEDHLISDTHTDSNGLDSWLGNVYNNGKLGTWGVDWNTDYYKTSQESNATTLEREYAVERTVVARNDVSSWMIATKLVASRPLGRGTLLAGSEFSFAKRNNLYEISEEAIANALSEVSEHAYSLFAEYSAFIPKAGMLSAGLRFEHTDFSYVNNEKGSESLSRHLNNVFPFFSFGTRLGKVETQLSYSMKTHRPNYYLLRSNIEYNNRYTLSTGDPTLENEIHHDVCLNTRYKALGLSLQYMCIKKGIYDWTYPYDNDGRVLIKWVNFTEPIHRFSAFLNASPTIGIWSPNYTIGIQKQWLEFLLPDPREESAMRTVRYHKPLFIINNNNAFHLAGSNNGWQLELNSELLSSGHYGNAEIRNWYWNLSCAIQKYFLKDKALSVRLAVSDIFHKSYNNVSLDLGNYILTQTHILGEGRGIYDLQQVTLSLRYNLNVGKSKYRGTGAGKEVRERM